MVDAISASVLQGIASFAYEEFKLLWNAKHDLERMKNTVLAIRATLLDAEEKANNNHQVSNWLARLKDVLYDADDLLDDFSTEALRRRIMTQNMVAKKVRIFFSKSNQVVYNLKMAHKLREVRARLDEIDDDRKKFQLIDHPDLQPLSVPKERKQTDSFVNEEEIIGREEEKNTILRFLLDSSVVKSNVSVILIVGFGGLGKTALAQVVYNHKSVQDYFELRRWVCVSDEFDVRQIAQKILEKESPKEIETGQVKQDLRELIEGKKFLIVLDDVWNEDLDRWNELKYLLTKGGEGSMIIVTTRSEKVGKIMGTYEPIILKGLDSERSWELFCRMAFEGGRESNDNELLAIGREVVKICGGVPLAIRAVGRLVYDKTLDGIRDLSYLRNCALWNVDKSLEERIFALLKLSYDHLPSSPMKNCFAFCSLFPKDFLFEKQILIQMWVAEGFIQSTNQMRREEDVGNEYFMNLCSRSFFQDVQRDPFGNIVTCKMHDIIHDLAQLVAKHEYHVIRDAKEERIEEVRILRHLSCDVPRESREVLTSSPKFEKLRTLLFFNNRNFDLIATKLRCLRVLNLCDSDSMEISKSIRKLKHLRFLDLSCYWLYLFSSAITELHNLQTLKLTCDAAFLPRDISTLVSLRHLHLTDCWELQCMPSGLGQLTSLQTLTDFVVGDQEMHKRRASARISELGELNNLRGSLTIRGLRHLRSNPEEAESARLKEKQHLQNLTLVWGEVFEELSEKDASDELILEKLRPHHTIKVLSIVGFRGERLPDWIGNLMELQHLVLHGCEYLISLPEGLPNLTSLRTLTILGSLSLPFDEWKKIAHIPRIPSSSLLKYRALFNNIEP